MSRVIAFFDFDGTVTTKDTLLEFIKYSKGNAAFWFGFLLHAPFLVAYKLNFISNQHAKERVLRYFFGRTPLATFNQYCDEFAKDILPGLIRPKALYEITKLQQAGAEVVIVSASPENWLRNWCQEAGVKCIATRLVVADNRISGKIAGYNCHGQEKVRRIKEAYELSSYSSVYTYGDTPGDRPMLALGSITFYKPFRV